MTIISELEGHRISTEDSYTCGGEGGWSRVVYLDMSNSNTNCPLDWELTTHSRRTCGKSTQIGPACDSAVFPVSAAYTRVCGTVRGYQYGQTDAFEAYNEGQVSTIDGAYVAGVSLTHGTPRQHIWTFAAGATETQPTWIDVCPCDATITPTICG